MGTLETKLPNTYENAFFQPPKLLWPSQITQWDATRPYWQNVIVTNSKEMLPTSLMIFSRLVHSKKSMQSKCEQYDYIGHSDIAFVY